MGKASSNKKVQRAARAGGGRKAARASRGSWLWPAVVSAVVVLGIVLIVQSRNDLTNISSEHPGLLSVTGDHWHVAYGVYVCGSFQPNLPQAVNGGIHTHGDGLIHVEATNSVETGKGANLATFVKQYGAGLSVTQKQIKLPGQKARKNGDKCSGKAAEVQIKVWKSIADKKPSLFRLDPSKLRLRDGEIITIAFVPTDTDIPQPPSVPNLANPNAAEAPASTAPPESTPASTAPPESTNPAAPPTSSAPTTSSP